MSLTYALGLLCGSDPGAAPEPAGGIQTPGIDGPPSPAVTFVAVPTTSPPHWSLERSLWMEVLSQWCYVPCKGQEQYDEVVPLNGVQVELFWVMVGRALWFCLTRGQVRCQNTDMSCWHNKLCISVTHEVIHLPARFGVSSLSGLVRSSCPLRAWKSAT